MNILLVLPRTFINLNEPEHFPVGMAYVSSYLKSKNYSVKVLNLNFEEGNVKDLLRDFIAENDISIVETGGLVINYHMVKEIIDCVKEIDRNIYTVIGGGLLTSAPEVVMSAIVNADFGIIGEGEITNEELLRAISGEIPFDEVDGLIYRELREGKYFVKRNKSRSEIKDLDSLPWPDYEGFALDKMLEYAPKKYVTMSTGRSCKYHCTFCYHTSGQTYRQRSLESFFSELDFLVNQYGIDNIYITDELFATNRSRLNEFCQRIVGYNILWAIQLRVDIVDRELLQKLKDSGCIIISFGLESADDAVLKSMNKGTTVRQIENALEMCRQVGIQANGAFIFGDINETSDSVNRTIHWWKTHREYNIKLALIQVYPGTALYRYAIKKGIIQDELKFIEEGCPYINVSKLSDEEYKQLSKRLVEIQTEYYQTLTDEKVLRQNKKRLRMDVSGKCKQCGEEITVENVSMALGKNSKCIICHTPFQINPYSLFSNSISQYLKHLFDSAEKIALYKPTNIAVELYSILDNEQRGKCIVVDSENIHIGNEFVDRLVMSEKVLNHEEIDTVIICDYLIERYDSNIIRTKFKNIRNIVCISDILRNSLPE